MKSPETEVTPLPVRRTVGGVPWMYECTTQNRSLLFCWSREANVLTLEELGRQYGLTPAQARVATLLHSRRTTQEIATLLGNSVNTINRHIEMVLLKLDVPNRWAVESALDCAAIEPGLRLAAQAIYDSAAS